MTKIRMTECPVCNNPRESFFELQTSPDSSMTMRGGPNGGYYGSVQLEACGQCGTVFCESAYSIKRGGDRTRV